MKSVYIAALKIALKLHHLTNETKYKDMVFGFAEGSKASVLAGSINEVQAKQYLALNVRAEERHAAHETFRRL